MPTTSLAPHSAASFVCRPLPQPPSRTTWSSKNSGFTGCSQPRNCALYFGSSCVKFVHCQPKFFAVSAFSCSTLPRSANRGTPPSTLYSRVHFLHVRTASMISLPSYFDAYARRMSPPQVGHASRSRSLSFIYTEVTTKIHERTPMNCDQRPALVSFDAI